MENKLKKLRDEFNFSLRMLAELINVTYSNISYMENGKVGITQKRIISLTELFQVSSDYLLGISNIGIFITVEGGNETLVRNIDECTLDKLKSENKVYYKNYKRMCKYEDIIDLEKTSSTPTIQTVENSADQLQELLKLISNMNKIEIEKTLYFIQEILKKKTARKL